MKTFKRLFSMIMSLILVFSFSTTAKAQGLSDDIYVDNVQIVGEWQVQREKALSNYIETIELDDGIICEVYRREEVHNASIVDALFAQGMQTKTITHEFFLSVNGTDIGYLKQVTNWQYRKGSGLPTFLSASNTLYTYQENVYRMRNYGYEIENPSSSSTKYKVKTGLEKNGQLIDNVVFATTMDNNANASFENYKM